jgi:hypothetical protein
MAKNSPLRYDYSYWGCQKLEADGLAKRCRMDGQSVFIIFGIVPLSIISDSD